MTWPLLRSGSDAAAPTLAAECSSQFSSFSSIGNELTIKPTPLKHIKKDRQSPDGLKTLERGVNKNLTENG